MRVDPKQSYGSIGSSAVTSFVGQFGGIRPAWEKLLSEHDSMTNAFLPNAVLI